MPPRLPYRPRVLRLVSSNSHFPTCQSRLASLARTQPSTSYDASVPIARLPATQPPSHKSPTLRKSQLHRQYQSLLRSSPLILIFQHNNLKASEWAAIRRQLTLALSKVDAEQEPPSNAGSSVRLQIIHTGIFESALKIVEFWDPPSTKSKRPNTSPSLATSTTPPDLAAHGLSEKAYKAATRAAKTRRHGLEPLLSGPLSLLSFPNTSPAHLGAALRILAPGDKFPAPKRKANPEYHEPIVQAGLQKLMLLGARIEGKAMDGLGVRWVGGIEGGLEGLRAQLVGLLGSAGVGLASVLEGSSRGLWMTLEGRRMALDEEQNPKVEDKTEAEKTDVKV